MRILDSLVRVFSGIASIDSKYVYYNGKDTYRQDNGLGTRTTLFHCTNYGLRRGFLSGKDLMHNLEVIDTVRTYESKNSIINVYTGHSRYWRVTIQLDGNYVFKDKIVFTSTGRIATFIGRIAHKIRD